ncbi:MAG TPA: helix-hairpin-helix domain-containing protein [Gemmatimonadaceae bacterium]
MPTPAERKALFFLSGLMLLGSGVRASAALSGAERDPAIAAGQPALERQIAAVDTARARSSSSRKSSTRRTGKKKSSSSRSASSGSVAADTRLSTRMAVSSFGGDVQPTVYYTSTKPGKVDVDVADAAALEGLPRIGPVMAGRIVANRDSLGPFGSLKELQRVKGVGPALATALSPYVTFSLRPRPSRVKEPAGRTGPKKARRRPPSHL